jgi:hypothetical protein
MLSVPSVQNFALEIRSRGNEYLNKPKRQAAYGTGTKIQSQRLAFFREKERDRHKERDLRLNTKMVW